MTELVAQVCFNKSQPWKFYKIHMETSAMKLHF